jgi:hypothetical protein
MDQRWEWMNNFDGNKVKLKQEADLLAKVVTTTRREELPFWATWDIGRGRSFAQIGDWTPAGGSVFMRWEYYGDFAVNLMMYVSNNPIPQDLETLHKARNRYLDYRSVRSYLFSVMEFAEKMGANMNPIGPMIAEADGEHAESIKVYLDFEFGKALDVLEGAITLLTEATERSMRLKDQAMVWIYVIEWFTVTATFAMGGFVIWTLMVRRRLYRQVNRTRFVR